MVPAGAAIAFALFLLGKLLWRMRRAGGSRGPLDPRIREVRARAARVVGPERARVLCEAGALAEQARRPTAAFGYYLRASRADPAAEAPIRGLAHTLARRPRALERALWRNVASLDVALHRAALRVTLEELAAMHARRRDRVRARALEKLVAALSMPASLPAATPASAPAMAEVSAEAVDSAGSRVP